MEILFDYQWVWFGIGFICIFTAFFILVKKENDRNKQIGVEAARLGFTVEGKKIRNIKKAPDFCLSAEQIPSTAFVGINNFSKGVFDNTEAAIYEYTYST